MGQVIFIVWRESVEALLIIGVLYAWLSATPGAARGKRWLAAGAGGHFGRGHLYGRELVWRASRRFRDCHGAHSCGLDCANGVVDARAWPHDEARFGARA